MATGTPVNPNSNLPKAQKGPLPALLMLLVLAVVGVQLRHLVFLPPRGLVERGVFVDDAFFYSVIARNLAQGNGLTFDGTQPTNGFQPLWLLAQSGLQWTFPTVHPVRILALSSYSTFLAAGLAWLCLARTASPKHQEIAIGVLGGLLIANPRFQALAVRGLETPLALLSVALLAFALRAVRQVTQYKRARIPSAQLVVATLVSAAVFLSRTDLFPLTLLSAFWLMTRPRASVSQRAMILGILTGTCGAYLCLNLVGFGGLVPLSGAVKRYYLSAFYPTFSAYAASSEWHGSSSAFFSILPLAGRLSPTVRPILFILMLTSLGIWTRGYWPKLTPEMRLFTLGLGVHLLVMHGWYRELRPYSSYYFAPLLMWLPFYTLGVLEAGTGCGETRSLRDRLRIALLLVAFVTALAGSTRQSLEPLAFWQARLALAGDMQTLARGAPVAAFWPGLFGQFYEGPVIPLDGLLNSREYFDTYLTAGRELDYARVRNCRFLAIYFEKPWSEISSTTTAPKDLSWSTLGTSRAWRDRDNLGPPAAVQPVPDEGAWYLIPLAQRD